MHIAYICSEENSKAFREIESFAAARNYTIASIPLNIGIANGYFISRATRNPDLLIIDADVKGIKTIQRSKNAHLDFETVMLDPAAFLTVMRASGVNIPVLALFTDKDSKIALQKAGIDRHLPNHATFENVKGAIEDLLADSTAEFFPDTDFPEP